ncbi:Dehydrogenase/reductase SDR member 11 [Homalodisca vitripennis]|nr:Dehydrogenase/reductase SDR member 11 [Homalodisca vitripennis]
MANSDQIRELFDQLEENDSESDKSSELSFFRDMSDPDDPEYVMSNQQPSTCQPVPPHATGVNELDATCDSTPTTRHVGPRTRPPNELNVLWNDVSDQLASYATTVRKGVKWYRKVAIELLTNTAVVNAHALYKIITNNSKVQITEFREKLATSMIFGEAIQTGNNSPRNPNVRKHELLEPEERKRDGNLEDWRKIFELNVFAAGACAREAVKSMRARNIDGHIININSICSHWIPNLPGIAPYSASKHAAKVISEGLRMDLASQKSKIKVTNISPGLVATPMLDSFKEGKELNIFFEPLNAKDIADAVHYVLGTPPNVQVTELIIRPVQERI